MGSISGTAPLVRHCAFSIEDVALIRTTNRFGFVVLCDFSGRVNGPHKKHPKCQVLVVIDAERF
jgi:hypothetical protein